MPPKPDPRAELIVAGLLVAAAAAAALFVVAYGVGWSTQVLGGTLAAALALVAAALLVIAKRLIVTEEKVEDYPDESHPDEQRAVAQIVRESGSGFTRKRLLGGAATLAGGTLGAALIAPAVSLGPTFDTSRLNESPWRAGRRLVDEQGRPLSADDIDVGPFYTAFPEGADKKAIAAPIVLVRLDPAALRLRPRTGRPRASSPTRRSARTRAARSRSIATRSSSRPSPSRRSCARATTRPSIPPTAATVLFGPAGRPLPQLPLTIDAERNLRAAGDYSGPGRAELVGRAQP